MAPCTTATTGAQDLAGSKRYPKIANALASSSNMNGARHGANGIGPTLFLSYAMMSRWAISRLSDSKTRSQMEANYVYKPICSSDLDLAYLKQRGVTDFVHFTQTELKCDTITGKDGEGYNHGPDNILICTKQIPNSVEKTNEILRKNATYTSVGFVDIKLDKILEYEEFSLQIGERNIPIRKERIDARGVNSYVFVGSNNEGCRVLISVLNNDIQGVIETDEEVFSIKTIGEQQYALMTLDYSQLREACDDLHEENYHSSFDDVNSYNHDSYIESDDNTKSS